MPARFLLNAGLLMAAASITGGTALGQAQSVQTYGQATEAVNRLLQSSDPKDAAWGAFTAMEYHVTSAVPLLIAALARNRAAEADPEKASELAILDALVQLHAEVPADLLQAPLARWPIPVLALLDHATGDRDAILLQRLDITSGFEWRAVANLLLRSKPPGFAFRLLDGLRLQLSVYVTDQPHTGLGFGSGTGSSEGCNYERSVAGVPPLARYGFAVAGPGATVLSVGPDTVYYVREMTRGLPCSAEGRIETPNDYDRVTYLSALLRPQFETVPLRLTNSVTVLWSTPEAFREDVARQRASIADQYRNIVSLLVSAKRLTADERQRLTPLIVIAVNDGRKDKSEPLPAVTGGGGVQSSRSARE